MPIPTRRGIIKQNRGLLFSCLLLFASSPLQATDLITLSGKRTLLATQVQSQKTLVLIVHTQDELRESQRLLTLAESHQLHTLILIALPDDQPIKARVFQHAAKRFFKSDFSQKRVLFVNESQRNYPNSKSLLFSTKQTSPIWQSEKLPDDREFETALFLSR